MPTAPAIGMRALTGLTRLTRVLPGAAGDRGRYFTALQRLEDGESRGWRAATARLLARSDAEAERGRDRDALAWYDKALRLAHHPTLHYTGEGSLLARDPAAFLAPFRASRVGGSLLDGDAPAADVPRPSLRERDAGEPLRLLVIAQRNWTFVDPVLTGLEETGGVIVRRLEVDDLPLAERPTRERVLQAAHDRWTAGRRLPTPTAVHAGYDWADSVLVEWGHHVLTWVSLLDERPRLLSARLHRFEAYTPFPLLTDFAAVDRLLFVSPTVSRLLAQLAPRLADVGRVIDVDNQLARGLGPEPEGERDPYLLAMVGWTPPVKDADFALDLLQELRSRDERFRLLLIGPGLPSDPARDTAHASHLRERRSRFPATAIEELGVRRDVPELLTGAGWILSCSRVESVHEAVMEGLAAGCAPVVRDWPDAVPYGGARAIYPDPWVVPDVPAAAARIRAVLETGRLAEESREARAWVVERRSPHRVIADYRRALEPEQHPA